VGLDPSPKKQRLERGYVMGMSNNGHDDIEHSADFSGDRAGVVMMKKGVWWLNGGRRGRVGDGGVWVMLGVH
jgi:hypothetical protein